jgi:transposase InsO family protein
LGRRRGVGPWEASDHKTLAPEVMVHGLFAKSVRAPSRTTRPRHGQPVLARPRLPSRGTGMQPAGMRAHVGVEAASGDRRAGTVLYLGRTPIL